MPESPYRELPGRFPPWNGAGYFARARRVWRRRRLMVAAVVLPLLWPGWALLRGDRRLYQSAPVAAAHAGVENDCGMCHTAWLQVPRRLDPRQADLRTVPDDGCVSCHSRARPQGGHPEKTAPDQPTGRPAPDHHPETAVANEVPTCSACHREHRGRGASLARVADVYCTACHAALHGKGGTVPDCAPTVTAFTAAGHPPFHYPTDPGKVRFNHRLHTAEGVMGPGAAPAPLACEACHQPDPSTGRRYMLPIRYGDHCQRCHPLWVPLAGEWSEPRLAAAAADFRSEPARHGLKPAEFEAELRQRYARFIDGHPDALLGPVAAPPRPRPGAAPAAAEVKDKQAWVARQMEGAKRALFAGGAGCRLCHESEGPGRADGLPLFAAPNLPTRWLRRGFFNHDKHVRAGCMCCHGAAAVSTVSSNVLMPARATCLPCHSEGAPADLRGDTRCVSCHRYHDLALEHAGRQRPAPAAGP
jgi:hypothetical protein